MRYFITIISLFGLFISQQSFANEVYNFALIPKGKNNVFFELSGDGCIDAAQNLENVSCEYIGPETIDASKQIQILQDLITRNIDGIAVAPVNSAALKNILKQAKRKNIPVITYDSDVIDKHKNLRYTYVGTNNYEIGKNIALEVRKIKPEGGTFCLQTGTLGEINLNERMQGVKETLGEKWTQVAGCPLTNTGDFSVTVNQMDEILLKYPKLDAFIPVAGWPQLFPSAYKKVMERNSERIKNGDTIIAIADTLPVQMELLKEGWGHINIGQKPYEMGVKALNTLYKIKTSNDEIDDPIYTGLDICLQSNHETCLDN